MATEYKLSYTASEIDRMLGEVDKPKSWNDLTDKPFGVKVIESDIMLDTITVETVADENGNYCSENFAFASEPETTGEEVNVEINGKFYKSTFMPKSYVLSIGNHSMAYNGDDTGEPFVISRPKYGDGLWRLNTKTPGVYTIKVFHGKISVTPLDENFIPSSYLKTDYMPATLIDTFIMQQAEEYINMAVAKDTSYIVTLDGVEYQCDSFVLGYQPNVVYLGNPAMAGNGDGKDNGMPFSIWSTIGENYGGIWATGDLPHTLSVEASVRSPLDESLIPDTIVRKADMINILKEGVPAPMFIHRLDGNNMYKIAYGNGVFVAINSDMGTSSSSCLYSTDGINWVEKQLPAAKYWVDVAFGNNTFVAIGNSESLGSSSNPPYIAYSLDGETWSTATVPSTVFNIASIHFLNNEFLVDFNSYYQILRSKDGATWSKLERADTRVGRGILAYNNGVYVSSSNGMQYTEDALDSKPNWISISEIDRINGNYYVCYGNNKFIAVASGGEHIYYSNDGIDWEIATMPVDFVRPPYTNALTVPVYTHGMFVVYSVYTRQFLYSTNGITWYATSGELVREGHSIYPFSVGDAMYFTYGAEEEPWGTIIMHMDVGCITGFARASDVEKKYATKEYAESLAILTSPNGTKYKLTVADDGTVSAVAVE